MCVCPRVIFFFFFSCNPPVTLARTLLQRDGPWNEKTAPLRASARGGATAPLSCGGAYKTFAHNTTQDLSEKCRVIAGAVTKAPASRPRCNRNQKIANQNPETIGAIFDQRGVSPSAEEWTVKLFWWVQKVIGNVSCIGYCKSPCHACLLFCMLVPARQTPLIDATSRPVAIVFMLLFFLSFNYRSNLSL